MQEFLLGLESLLDFKLEVLFFLFLVAFVAGFIDAIAGGGGMITIPALLISGIPPIESLATNKLQASFGSFSAALHFYKKGYIDLKKCITFAILAFIFSAFGTLVVQRIQTDLLAKILPFLIILFGIYFLFTPNIGAQKTRGYKGFLGIAIAAIGFYDGFFGPGTGSFLLLALILLGGFEIRQSLGEAKLYNFATNLASLVFFMLGGHILWIVGLVMAFGQFIGANLGSKMAIRYGVRIIRPLVVIISLALSTRLLYQAFM